MDTKTTEWRAGPNVCRCCLSEGCYKDISTEYFWMGKREVYAEILTNTLNVSIAYSQSGGPNSNSRLICELCISRLRDASDFKRQVLECEKTFMQHLDAGSSAIADVEVHVEAIDSDVKLERVKQEKALSDDDDDDFEERCGFDDDDDDDLDDEPLTKLASKIPKKESVDLLDLLDNTKATAKRKSTTKTKSVAAKKSKTVKKEPIKAGASKLPRASKLPAAKTEKKKKGDNPPLETSIWQLTVPERRNATTFIQHTTVRPFIFKGSSFRCFFCTEYHSDPATLLEHTTTHKIENRAEIFDKYVAKGKRCLQVDISYLKCRLCGESHSNLDSIREHLKNKHGTHFFLANNGMTEYNLELVNNMYVCHICAECFHNFGLLNGHMNSHVGKVVCETCGEGFLYQHLLLKHKESHLAKPFTCKECDRSFVKKSQLTYHTNIVHKGKQRFKLKKCPKCPQTFKEHYAKLLHLKKIHGIAKTLLCHLCKTIFTTRRALTEHLTRLHTERLKCEVCGKCFGIQSRLTEHMRGHTGERNFICPVCKNTYMHPKTLAKHMRTHDMGFKYNCSDCGAGFKRKNDFDKHMKHA